jgi:rRNA-processing protein FCF1
LSLSSPVPTCIHAKCRRYLQQLSEKLKGKAKAAEVGTKQMGVRKDWFDDECAQVTAMKNKSYFIMQQTRRTRAAWEEYKAKRREEKIIHRSKNGLMTECV